MQFNPNEYPPEIIGHKEKLRIKNQNNYIQINGIELTEEKISKLKPEQLQTIEAVLQSLD